MTSIKDLYHSNMTLDETKKLIMQTLKAVMEEKITVDNVEITVVPTETKKLVSLKDEEL